MPEKLALHFPQNAREITVIKTFAGQNRSFSWKSTLLNESPTTRLLNSWFNGKPGFIGKCAVEDGDRFVEQYFNDRWYNHWKIHDGESDVLKCIYFNLTRPAIFNEDQIEWEDLALDVAIFPDGTRELLDQNEFALLNLDEKTRQICWQTVSDLLNLI